MVNIPAVSMSTAHSLKLCDVCVYSCFSILTHSLLELEVVPFRHFAGHSSSLICAPTVLNVQVRKLNIVVTIRWAAAG